MKGIYKVAILLVAIIAAWLSFSWFAPRYSRFFFSVTAVLAVPLVVWHPKAFRFMLSGIFLVNLLLTVPVDLDFRAGDRFDIRILPVSFGFFEQPGTVGYGCIVWRNPPKYALLITLSLKEEAHPVADRR